MPHLRRAFPGQGGCDALKDGDAAEVDRLVGFACGDAPAHHHRGLPWDPLSTCAGALGDVCMPGRPAAGQPAAGDDDAPSCNVAQVAANAAIELGHSVLQCVRGAATADEGDDKDWMPSTAAAAADSCRCLHDLTKADFADDRHKCGHGQLVPALAALSRHVKTAVGQAMRDAHTEMGLFDEDMCDPAPTKAETLTKATRDADEASKAWEDCKREAEADAADAAKAATYADATARFAAELADLGSVSSADFARQVQALGDADTLADLVGRLGRAAQDTLSASDAKTVLDNLKRSGKGHGHGQGGKLSAWSPAEIEEAGSLLRGCSPEDVADFDPADFVAHALDDFAKVPGLPRDTKKAIVDKCKAAFGGDTSKITGDQLRKMGTAVTGWTPEEVETFADGAVLAASKDISKALDGDFGPVDPATVAGFARKALAALPAPAEWTKATVDQVGSLLGAAGAAVLDKAPDDVFEAITEQVVDRLAAKTEEDKAAGDADADAEAARLFSLKRLKKMARKAKKAIRGALLKAMDAAQKREAVGCGDGADAGVAAADAACPDFVVDSEWTIRASGVGLNAEQVRQKVEAKTGHKSEVLHTRPADGQSAAAAASSQRRLSSDFAPAADSVPETTVTVRTAVTGAAAAAEQAAKDAAGTAIEGATAIGATLVGLAQGAGSAATTRTEEDADGQGAVPERSWPWYVFVGGGVGVALAASLVALVVVKAVRRKKEAAAATAGAPVARATDLAHGVQLHGAKKQSFRKQPLPASYV